MASLPAPPVALSQVGRAAHDLGLAGLLGGNLFGRLALHPCVTAICDREERGKVVNAAWRRYGTVNSLSLLAVVAGWAGARAAEARPAAGEASGGSRGQGRARRPRRADRLATAARASASPARPQRRRPAARRRPCRGRREPASKRAKRRLNALGAATLVAEVAARRRQRRAHPGGLPPPAAAPSLQALGSLSKKSARPVRTIRGAR